MLQSHLQLREGECVQLRREVQQLSRSREGLLAEIASLSARSERLALLAGESGLALSSTVSTGDATQEDADESVQLQRRYESLLVEYGKLVEENRELRMDIADVKELYRNQVGFGVQKYLHLFHCIKKRG